MSNKTTKRSNSSKKNTTKGKRSLPKFISMNTAGTYRVRKSNNGVKFDKTVPNLTQAKKLVKTIG